MTTGTIPRNIRNRKPERVEPTATLTPLEIIKWMRQWDIAFNGTRGADANRFVRKIRRLRTMAPVADRDLLLCLLFYLKGFLS